MYEKDVDGAVSDEEGSDVVGFVGFRAVDFAFVWIDVALAGVVGEVDDSGSKIIWL
jgi:hypothetical protein